MRPGVLLVLANFFVLVTELIILDLPTFDLPTKQHSGKFSYKIFLHVYQKQAGFV